MTKITKNYQKNRSAQTFDRIPGLFVVYIPHRPISVTCHMSVSAEHRCTAGKSRQTITPSLDCHPTNAERGLHYTINIIVAVVNFTAQLSIKMI